MDFVAKRYNELTTDELYEILRARARIFFIEQNIHYLDMDGIDRDALHCFLLDRGEVVAYLRAFYADDEKQTVKIGRVLTLTHGRGLGRWLMERSLPVIAERMPHRHLSLHSQTPVIGFYEKLGFVVTSEEFTEAGIPHRAMEWRGK